MFIDNQVKDTQQQGRKDKFIQDKQRQVRFVKLCLIKKIKDGMLNEGN